MYVHICVHTYVDAYVCRCICIKILASKCISVILSITYVCTLSTFYTCIRM